MKHQFEINKILIPVDFSECSLNALDHAANLCKTFDAEMHLVHVFKTSTIDVLPNITATSATFSNLNELKNRATDELDALGKKVSKEHDVAYNVEVKDGSVSKAIVSSSKEFNADLIVMGTHGASGFEEFFLGSNAYRVVTSASCPVLTIRNETEKKEFKNIVLPIDSSKHTRDKVSEAVMLAQKFNSKVHIAHLVQEDDDKAVLNLKVKQVEEHLENKGITFETTKLDHGNIGEMTLTFAYTVKADLIVVMTDQENYNGFFVGEYAQRIVNHSKLPVLSVTPMGIVKGFTQDQLGGASNPF